MIGSTLQQARQRQNLSLGALSLKSGISKATLSRWEAGKSRPYAPELATVLEALQIPEATRRQCFQQLGTSQAERYLSQTTSEGAPLPISGGELLRALRQRAGLAQTDAARAVGVTQAMLSRWENNDCWPDDEKLSRLCTALGTTSGEREGLTTHGWCNHEELPRDKDALDAASFQLGVAAHYFEHDLYYLALGSRYGNLYKNNQIDRTEALGIWGHFGSYLAWHERMDDAYRMAAPVVENLKNSPRTLSKGQVFAVSAMALSSATLASPQKALEMLLAFEDRISATSRSNWYDDLSIIARKAGQIDRACHYHEKSIEVSQSEAIQVYARLRYAEKLCLDGHPAEALAQAHRCRINTWNPHAVIHHKLVYGGALALLGDRAEADSTLSQARQRLQETPFPGLNDFSRQLQTLTA